MRTRSRRLRFMWDRVLGQEEGALEKRLLESELWQQAQRGVISAEEYWRRTGDSLGLDQLATAQLRLDFYQEDVLDLQLITLIGKLRQREIAVGLLSNNTTELLTELEILGLHNLFDACVISAQIGELKPHPVAYQTILIALKTPAESALMVDDFPENIAGARQIGMEGVQFRPEDDLLTHLNTWLSHPRFASRQ